MSDSMNGPRGLIVGTAGHIDHGKTSLIGWLTGIDTDRLAEEKRRGISIDLGFAHLTLPNGITVGFVDVPGHERFVKNMLAGVAGIEAVMLIVAADESVMPQTREHFEICRLLDLKLGFVVLTKIDLASPEQIGITCQDVRALCAGSFLEHAPILQASSKTGQGIDVVIQQLEHLSSAPRPSPQGRLARLPVDRSFTINGFGTVVTGTLSSGVLRTGDAVLLHPSGKQARIRAIQVHGSTVPSGFAGQRTAINLSGLDTSEVSRGDILTKAEKIETTKTIDTWIDWLDRSEIPAGRKQFLFHIGTLEVIAGVKVLQKSDEGARTLARIWLPEAALIFPLDRFILRRPSPARTVGGGQVLDAFPPVRLNRATTLSRLWSLAHADASGRIQLLVEESAAGCKLEDLLRWTGLERAYIKELVRANPHLLLVEPSELIVTKAWLGDARKRALDWLADFHRDHPSQAGAPLSQARLGMAPDLAGVVFDRFPAIRIQEDLVSLSSHKALYTDDDQRTLTNIESALRAAGYQPPSVKEVLQAAAQDLKKGRALLELLIKNKKLVRISEDFVFHAAVIDHVRTALMKHKGRRFSVPEFKEWTRMSRKYAIPVLEYLDRERVTKRDGDTRLVL